MDLHRIPIDEKSLKGDEIHAGTISETEARLLLTDAHKFLDKAKIKVDPDARITVTRRPSKPLSGAAAARIRIIIIIAGPVVVIIFDHIVIVAMCW
jgi:hypothetical protein